MSSFPPAKRSIYCGSLSRSNLVTVLPIGNFDNPQGLQYADAQLN